MRAKIVFLISCLLAAIIPFLLPLPAAKTVIAAFPGWPSDFEGRPLRELPLSQREKKFDDRFPGYTARFTDGERELIIRWVAEETRKLHSAYDCFQGIGYSITPLPIYVDAKQ
ncbi:MAG: hypothetical protein AB1489_04870, partial [Acidobacteriota bacterium]